VLRITDAQWELIRKHFPEEHYPDDRPGRKPIPARKVLEAALWILNTGAQWHMLPQSYPNYKTVHRRFQQWCQSEVIRAALTDLANTLREQGEVDESECYIDATFASAKGGGDQIGPTRRGKGVKIMAIVDRHGLPLAVTTHAANHHEVTLVQLTFDFYMIEAKPENLVGDKAYDSDPLDRASRTRRRDDFSAQVEPHQAQDAGRPPAAPLRAPLDRRTLLCVDSVATPTPGSLGVLLDQFPRLRAACGSMHSAQTVLR